MAWHIATGILSTNLPVGCMLVSVKNSMFNAVYIMSTNRDKGKFCVCVAAIDGWFPTGTYSYVYGTLLHKVVISRC